MKEPTTLIDSPDSLVGGKWYVLGFREFDDSINWPYMPLYKYEGNGEWSDDCGNEVDATYDPFLQVDVHPSAADCFWPQ